MLKGLTKSLFVSVIALGFVTEALGQNTKSLSDLQGLESNRDRANSPSQVVILNNSPSSSQEQDSYQSSRNNARQGWGTGESLEYLRNHRMRKEAQNEQALMEKLEESRVDDERSRLERLFRIREYNQRQHQHQVQNHYNQDPVVIIHPDVKEEAPAPVHQPQSSHSSYEKMSLRNFADNWYVRGQFGVGTYNAENTESSASWGLAIGKNINQRLHIEFNFLSSNYTVDDPRGNSERVYDYYEDYTVYQAGPDSNLRDLTQLNYTSFLGYNIIIDPIFKVALRGGLSYVQRDSESTRIDGFSQVSTDAVDVVFGASSDFRLAHKLYVVGTFDYFTNLTNEVFESTGDDVERVEVSDYFVVGVGLKYEF